MRKLFLFFLLISLNVQGFAGSRPKIGLVLSGGGARGAAHIPVLEMLDSLHIPIDYIAGTSMGGLAGAFYAVGYSGKDIRHILLDANWGELFSDLPDRDDLPFFEKQQQGRYQLDFGMDGITPKLPLGLIEGQKVFQLFSGLTYPYSYLESFDRLPIPFRCVAVDLLSGKEDVLGAGSLPKAMRATMSIPTVFSPVPWDDKLLIDGGVVNNLPVDVVKEMGADIVIAVNVGTPLKKRRFLKSAVDILEQTFNIPGSYREKENIKKADILIEPNLGDFSAGDFGADQLIQMIRLGKVATEQALPQLVALKSELDSLGASLPISHQPHHYPSPEDIFSIEIQGNRQLSFSFIYNLLGIKPGQKLNLALLDNSLQLLYSLKYFKSIYYDVIHIPNGKVKLLFHIREKAFRRLRIGFRYDDYRRILLAVKLQGTNVVFPGFRGELEYQFPGVSILSYRLSYPSRSLNQPFYPYIRAKHVNIPRIGYDPSGKAALTYSEKYFQAAAGIGILPDNSLNLSAELNLEINRSSSNISSSEIRFNDQLRKVQLQLDYDHLDDLLIPRRGIMIKSKYEQSSTVLGSSIEYWRFSTRMQAYFTPLSKNTWHVSAFYGKGSSNMPLYKKFIAGGPDTYVGGEYEQFNARELASALLEYRYAYKNDIYFKLIFNTLFRYQYIASEVISSKPYIIGFGAGVKFLSLLGPVEIVFARGQSGFSTESVFQNVFNLKAGYVF